MSIFALFALCVQVGLIQNVYSQCGITNGGFRSTLGQGVRLGPSISQAYEPIGLNSQAENIFQESEVYGGFGVGEVFANGLLPVEGHTSIAGQVPIIGLVRFDGPVPAKGSVSISGSCDCGCHI